MNSSKETFTKGEILVALKDAKDLIKSDEKAWNQRKYSEGLISIINTTTSSNICRMELAFQRLFDKVHK